MSANIAASNAETVHAEHLDGHQEDKSEGDADRLDDLLSEELDRLAAELRARLSPPDRRRLANLLAGVDGCQVPETD
ncbi:MAG: hypothetical protein KJ000_34325 [Pirellulaceae bacterium]|nr:hypothetical protein [Pirellulaceae bacterium]